MRSVFLVAAGAASLLSSVAFAADMAIAPPPAMYAPPPVEDFGGWYLRGDIGFSNQKVNHLDTPGYHDPGITVPPTIGLGFDTAGTFGLGAGYRFNNWFRADITGEYRSKVHFSGTDFANIAGIGPISDAYSGGYSSWVGMINAYADLGTWWCVTPFVGVGIGGAYNMVSGLSDAGVISAVPGPGPGTPAYYQANGANKFDLAWALHAGLAYKVNNNLTIELAYRYLDLGSAVTGGGSTFDGTVSNRPFQFNNLTSQDLKFGVRWTCCDVDPPPPPLIRKG
jgi:opacity protein-like surface antigen